MDVGRIHRMAELSVMRGCAFALLGIFTVMIGLSPIPIVAGKAGAAMILVMAAVLWWKAERIKTQNPRDTEVWLMLDLRPNALGAAALGIINRSLRDILLVYARRAAAAAACLWALSFAAGHFV
jgi:heme A synthase